jgi:hypothetical protein
MTQEFVLKQYMGIVENLGEKANETRSALSLPASCFSSLHLFQSSLTRPYFTGKSSVVHQLVLRVHNFILHGQLYRSEFVVSSFRQ